MKHTAATTFYMLPYNKSSTEAAEQMVEDWLETVDLDSVGVANFFAS